MTKCKDCGAPVLWARQAGGQRWHPLEPEIVGDPKPDDFPLNVVEREVTPLHERGRGQSRVKVLCHLVSYLDSQTWLNDTAELHRHHECKEPS